jgi:hypothetical protein
MAAQELMHKNVQHQYSASEGITGLPCRRW